MDEYTRKYLLDVLMACDEVLSYFPDKRVFVDFQSNMMCRRAVERNVEIMGEAINLLLKHNKDVALPNARAIVATRNRVIHAYDNVTPEFLWSLVINHIPRLKADVELLLSQ